MLAIPHQDSAFKSPTWKLAVGQDRPSNAKGRSMTWQKSGIGGNPRLLAPWRIMGRNAEKPRQPFADEPLEALLVLGTCASPIRGIHAAANPVFQVAPKSPVQAYVALRREVYAAQGVLEARVGA